MVSVDARVVDARARLEALRPTISALRTASHAASVTYAVLHHGRPVLTGASGLRDVANALPATADTAYFIGSTMKAMLAACAGMLVHDGRLRWEDTLASHVAGFHHVGDPAGVGARATVRDALSHTTGIAQADLSWYGADGANLVDAKDLVEIVAHMPLAEEFRARWSYCNYGYSLVGRVLDAVSEERSWARFIETRLLAPLGMRRSKLNRGDVADGNVAEPHYVRDDGSLARLPPAGIHEGSIVAPAGCLLSTAPDMLRWAQAVLASVDPARTREERDAGVLKEMHVVTAPRVGLPLDMLQEATYGLGWARLAMPSPAWGFMSPNEPLTAEHTIGRDGRRRMLMLHHGGMVTGYLATVCLFPETQSAVVALSNTHALGDAADWAARALVQELFELTPRVDLVALATAKAAEARGRWGRLMAEYRKHRGSGGGDGGDGTLDGWFGRYENAGLKLRLDVRPTRRAGKAGEFLINDMPSQHHYLEYFGQGLANDGEDGEKKKGARGGDADGDVVAVFGFPEDSREDMEGRAMVDYYVYTQLLLAFRRETGEGGRARDTVEWAIQEGVPPVVFERVG